MLISVEFCIDIGTFGLVFMSQRQRQICKLLNVFLMNSVYFVPCIDSKYDIPQASSTISYLADKISNNPAQKKIRVQLLSVPSVEMRLKKSNTAHFFEHIQTF